MINRSPQSIRFCRPLKIEFIKETRELILAEKENLDTQTRNLHIKWLTAYFNQRLSETSTVCKS